MRTQSNEPIEPIQEIGDNSYYIHKNITTKTDDESGLVSYEADTLRVDNVTYEEVIEIAAKITTI